MPLRTERPDTVPETIDALFRRFQRQILAHLVRLVSDQSTAEDLCQDTFARAIHGWPHDDPPANVSAWLYRIATNIAYDHLRRRRRIHFMPLHPATPAETHELDGHDERDEVRAALAGVPERYRVPLVMHACDGYSMDEIARVLGCTNAAVKMRLFRGRAHFRAAYTHSGMPAEPML
jgi:RNA polymerase sigma-70 factor (ECF subfamily)